MKDLANNKPVLFGFIFLILAAVIGIGFLMFGPEPADICPNLDGTQSKMPNGMVTTSTGECVSTTVINVTGAQPTFQDPDIQRILLEKKGWTVNVLTNSNLTDFKNDQGNSDFSNVAVIFGGSSSFPDELRAKWTDPATGKVVIPTSGTTPINILSTKTTFSSPVIMYIKAKDLSVFMNAGLIQKNGDHYTISGANAQKIAQAMVNDQYWSSLGVNFPADGLVRVGYSYPAFSSGGRATFAYLLGCAVYTDPSTIPCSRTLTLDTIDANLAIVSKLKKDYGSQPGGDNSVSYWFDWANSNQPAQKVVFGNESIIFSWLASPNVPASQRQAAMDSIIGVYPEYTYVNVQSAVVFSSIGQELVDFMTSDPDIIKVLNEKLGQRVGFGGNLPKLMDWIATNDTFTVILDPSAETSGRIKELFK